MTARALVIVSLIAGATACAQEPQAEIPPPLMAVTQTPAPPTVDARRLYLGLRRPTGPAGRWWM